MVPAMKSYARNIAGMPTMPAMCHTCPFGPNGDHDLRARIESRLLTVSQTCHSTGAVHGAPDTYVCRGARDWQQMILYRLGFLEAPTDEAWRKQADGQGKQL